MNKNKSKMLLQDANPQLRAAVEMYGRGSQSSLGVIINLLSSDALVATLNCVTSCDPGPP